MHHLRRLQRSEGKPCRKLLLPEGTIPSSGAHCLHRVSQEEAVVAGMRPDHPRAHHRAQRPGRPVMSGPTRGKSPEADGTRQAFPHPRAWRVPPSGWRSQSAPFHGRCLEGSSQACLLGPQLTGDGAVSRTGIEEGSGGNVGVMEPPSVPLPFHVCWRGPQPGICVRASMESGQGPSLVTPCVSFPGTFPDDDHLIGVCPLVQLSGCCACGPRPLAGTHRAERVKRSPA